jgi:hypothetical protein
MSTTTDIHPAIARAVEAFNDHDADGFVAEFADDGTFVDPVKDDGLTKAELREYMTDLLEAFPDVRVEEERVIASGSETAVESMFHATHEGGVRRHSGDGRDDRCAVRVRHHDLGRRHRVVARLLGPTDLRRTDRSRVTDRSFFQLSARRPLTRATVTGPARDRPV